MTQSRNTFAIIVMILLFGMISFVTNLASPMGDILKHQFNIPNWQGTRGVFANFIAYAIMGIPSGVLLQRHGYKRTALMAISIGFIGIGIQTISGFCSQSSAFAVYLTGAFVAGFSMCLLNTVVNPMLNRLGGGGNKGNQLIQFGGTFNSLCGTAVIILTGLLLPQGIKNAQISDVLPLMITALSVFAMAFVVILFAKIPEQKVTAEEKKETANPLSYRHFLLGTVCIFIYVGVEVGIPNVMNKWLQNPDINILGGDANAEAIAGSVAATYWLMMMIGRFLGGLTAGKVSSRTMLAAVSVTAIVLVVSAILMPTTMVKFPAFNGVHGFGMESIPLSAALLVCTGLCTSVMWGGIFNLAVEGLGASTEKASGIFMTMVCGGGILPLLQNGVIDIFGASAYLDSYWIVVAGLAYILFFAAIGSRPIKKKIAQ